MEAYVIGGLRSFIGKENGMYRNIPAEILGARVLKKVVQTYSIEKVDQIIAGNGVGGGGNIARLMALEAGLSEKIPAYTVDLQCGSAIEAIAIAAAKIKAGMADVIIAGGFESSSTAPRRGYSSNHPDYKKMGGLNSWYKVAKFIPGEHSEDAMLMGAEKTAISEHIERKELNNYVIQSHKRALHAQKENLLKNIVVSVSENAKKDECIREKMNDRLLDRLPSVLSNGIVTTAGNACFTNDGAAFVVVCSDKYARNKGWNEVYRLAGYTQIGVNPEQSPKSAIKAIETLLQQEKLDYHDISIFECNEAFAVIDALFARKYPDALECYNIFGGALAYGHPYGASGAIITLHAIEALKHKKGKKAVCSIAAAGGIGTAILLESMLL